MPPAPISIIRDDLLDNLSDEDGFGDQTMTSPIRPHSPDLFGGAADNQAADGNPNPGSTSSAVPASSTQSATPLAGNLRPVVQGLISLKKLTDNSAQELHRYAKANQAEREVMNFALLLELRDQNERISTAIIASGIHPDLATNAKLYAGAIFFSPNLTYYRGPRSGARAGGLQKAVLDTLISNRVAHLPSTNDKASIDKIISMIGTILTDYRSSTKSLLGARKLGEPGMDLGSLVTRITKSCNLKITAQHYGRIAFLSRQFNLWNSRENSGDGIAYWAWVDQALVNTRKENGTDQEKINRYFRKIVDKDTETWSEPLGGLSEISELEEWQRSAECTASKMPAK